jgi:hypothetical protein
MFDMVKLDAVALEAAFPAACSLFSPAGRRWRKAPDEGAAGAEIAAPLIASHTLGTSPRGGEEGDCSNRLRSKYDSLLMWGDVMK